MYLLSLSLDNFVIKKVCISKDIEQFNEHTMWLLKINDINF